MIISQLHGGLGNQLFQYAMARSLALDTRQEFVLDRSRTLLRNARPYALGPFNIKDAFAPLHEVFLFSLPLFNVRKFLLEKLDWKIIAEAQFHYSEIKVDPRKKNYVKGYWQSYRYFENHKKRSGVNSR